MNHLLAALPQIWLTCLRDVQRMHETYEQQFVFIPQLTIQDLRVTYFQRAIVRLLSSTCNFWPLSTHADALWPRKELILWDKSLS